MMFLGQNVKMKFLCNCEAGFGVELWDNEIKAELILKYMKVYFCLIVQKSKVIKFLLLITLLQQLCVCPCI